MKIAVSILLIILFVPLFLIGLLSATVKFQLISSDFWLTTFEKNNIYTRMAQKIKETAESNLVSDGGSLKEAKVLTDLITPANVKDLVSNNLINLFGFMNGKTGTLNVYVPIGKFPKGLLPASVAGKSEVIPIDSLLSEFNVKGIGEAQIQALGQSGLWIGRIFVVDLVLIVGILFLLYLLTGPGKRFWNIGQGLLLSGFLVLGGFGFLVVVRGSMLTDWTKGSEPSQLILSTFLPYLLKDVLIVWLGVGVFLVIVGISLFFVKKRVYNVPK